MFVRSRWRVLLAVLAGAAVVAAGGYVMLGGGGEKNAAQRGHVEAAEAADGARYLEVEAQEAARGAGQHLRVPSAEAMEKARAAAASANVVICIIDAARADHMGCYGYPRKTTPNIDRLAQEGVVFEEHFVPYCHTKASTVSLFTGLYPDAHLVRVHSTMERGQFTLARGLESGGLSTAFFSSNVVASPAMGIGTDFQEIFARGEGEEQLADRTPETLLEVFARWLERRDRSRFFAYVHFVPPHLPYEAPPVLKALFAGKEPPNAWQGRLEFPEAAPPERPREPPPLDEWVNLYDANLRWADWAVGELESLLRESGVLDNTVFIVTSDHGEAFREHGYRYHSRGVYDELVHVPLLIRFPGEERVVGRVTGLSQTVDLLPTVFDLLGVRYPDGEVQGCSLLPVLSGEARRVREYVYATAAGPGETYLIRDERSALILLKGGRQRALYDLEADPQQRHNVIDDQPERAAEMVAAFRTFAETQRRPPLDFIDADAKVEEMAGPPAQKLSDDIRRDLEALGYLQ